MSTHDKVKDKKEQTINTLQVLASVVQYFIIHNDLDSAYNKCLDDHCKNAFQIASELKEDK